ncbi:hypothetical protein [Pedobacter nyackensis]|uniref:hypothetical protein n=1 Tax=Pedobacter nyackensis TaxID=475255 RepID=UPI002930C88D|nr:hypothetical protein [Pedobacter nyackensis]
MNILTGMNTKSAGSYLLVLLLGLLLLLWPVVQRLVINGDPTIGVIDPNIWLLLLLSLISFLLITGLCWWLLQRLWTSLGLPVLGNMVSQFKTLESWQQLSFFWASFALLLLTVLGVFSAVI